MSNRHHPNISSRSRDCHYFEKGEGGNGFSLYGNSAIFIWQHRDDSFHHLIYNSYYSVWTILPTPFSLCQILVIFLNYRLPDFCPPDICPPDICPRFVLNACQVSNPFWDFIFPSLRSRVHGLGQMSGGNLSCYRTNCSARRNVEISGKVFQVFVCRVYRKKPHSIHKKYGISCFSQLKVYIRGKNHHIIVL